MLFDPRRYLEEIDRVELNQEMRPLEGSGGAIRATRAIRAAPEGPMLLHHRASHDPGRNHEMRPSEGPAGAIRATRATPPLSNSTNSTNSAAAGPLAQSLIPDLASLLTLLRDRGPLSYGAAASALGWDATRAWRVEAEMRAAGRIEHDRIGRAAVKTRADA